MSFRSHYIRTPPLHRITLNGIHRESLAPQVTVKNRDDLTKTLPSLPTMLWSYAMLTNLTTRKRSCNKKQTAVWLAPNDIQAWKALAHAQMRDGDTEDAFKSISRAIDLKPSQGTLPALVAINATKILCAQGKDDKASVYLNVAIGMNGQLLAVAKSDGELQRMCAFEFN